MIACLPQAGLGPRLRRGLAYPALASLMPSHYFLRALLALAGECYAVFVKYDSAIFRQYPKIVSPEI